MTRAQALTIAILTGLVVLVCLGLFALIAVPFERLFPPAPTPTPIIPTPTPTPTLPKLLPTASLATITLEPTATNTRVPTATPRPPRSPTPTVIINLTLPPRKPTPTQTSTPLPFPTPTPSATISPIPPPRGYSIKFEAKETRLVEGECTDLRWTVEGASSVRLDGESVAASDKKKICPKRDTKYTLTVQLPDSTQVKRTVQVSVEEEEK